MDLQVTIQMSKLSNLVDVKVLHIEPTSVCNASCPQCQREDPTFYNDETDRSEITLTKCKELFTDEFISNLEKMFMCGNFGEPAAAQEALDIFKHFKSVNPNITLGMNTNGSIRSTAWWRELAEVFSGNLDYVVFSIDGLEDTNHIYRRNTIWKKIIDNASAFISAGGTAHWDMLVYEHNEHQIEEAKKLAYDLGFSWFRAKVSKRFIHTPVTFLNPPNGFQLPNVIEKGPINCHAKREKSIYVAANGHIMPCCWFGAEAFTLDNYAKELLSNWDTLEDSWDTNPHRICTNTCSEDVYGTSFSKQWQIEEQLR